MDGRTDGLTQHSHMQHSTVLWKAHRQVFQITSDMVFIVGFIKIWLLVKNLWLHVYSANRIFMPVNIINKVEFLFKTPFINRICVSVRLPKWPDTVKHTT
jgi:hypothetical protein